MKKGYHPKKAAPITKANSNTITNLCPRQFRVLTRLSSRPSTVRELFNIAGNNPAETVRQLRKTGLNIILSWHKGLDQDGKKIRFGIYHLPDESKQLARQMLGGE